MLCERQLRFAGMGGEPVGYDLQAVAAVQHALGYSALALVLVACACEPGLVEGLKELRESMQDGGDQSVSGGGPRVSAPEARRGAH